MRISFDVDEFGERSISFVLVMGGVIFKISSSANGLSASSTEISVADPFDVLHLVSANVLTDGIIAILVFESRSSSFIFVVGLGSSTVDDILPSVPKLLHFPVSTAVTSFQ